MTNKEIDKQIMAIASKGGHWIQLLRLIPAFIDCELIFVSTTKEQKKKIVDKDYKYYYVTDIDRKKMWKFPKTFYQMFSIISTLRPDFIITTGALPGLLGVFIGKLFRIKTVWIDSVANVERISLSGKFASSFVSKIYTQWEHLADGKKIFYSGSVL